MKQNRRPASLRAAALAAALLLACAGCLAAMPREAGNANACPAPEVSAAPEAVEAEPAPRSGAAETIEPAAPESDTSAQAFEYLPVIHRVDTEKKQIAITVDDCFQVDNLRKIMNAASAAGGRLTLFPIGQNLQKPGMPELMRKAAFDLGFEIENHTWSHQRIFRLPEGSMASEIWRQGQALNRALGANYEQHFFRLMGGDGESDQRTHNYLEQLGFKGIAGWSISGSDADMSQVKRALKPGAIYLFHTTDRDTAMLRQFIPWAASQGYELVTLNELMGLAPNAVSEYAEADMPAPRACAEDYHTHSKGDYAWNVVRMQDALRSMGYLGKDGASTGYYGAQTERAVKRFQSARGLPCTGVADTATQKALIG